MVLSNDWSWGKRFQDGRSLILKTAATAGDPEPTSRARGSADGKSLRGDIQGRGFLLNWPKRNFAGGRPGT